MLLIGPQSTPSWYVPDLDHPVSTASYLQRPPTIKNSHRWQGLALSFAGASCSYQATEALGVPSETVDTVLVRKGNKKGLGEDPAEAQQLGKRSKHHIHSSTACTARSPLELDSVQRSGVFYGLLKGVQSWIEVAVDLHHVLRSFSGATGFCAVDAFHFHAQLHSRDRGREDWALSPGLIDHQHLPILSRFWLLGACYGAEGLRLGRKLPCGQLANTPPTAELSIALCFEVLIGPISLHHLRWCCT